jgi:hypothetical protein
MVASSYRRLQRFFQNVTLEGDWLALAVVKLLKLKAPWIFKAPTVPSAQPLAEGESVSSLWRF